jgi:short-subunit dehydrogenase involved in D-alanine esterification of teichoic acids
MFREAIIPQVNDGKPFEALTATLQFDYQNCGTVSILYYRDGVQIEEPLIEGLDTVAGDLFVNLIKWQLAQALNPPIKVTQAVLDAMEKVPEAKYLVQECSGLGRADKYPLHYYTDGTKSRWYYQSKEDYKNDRNYGDSHPFGDYIQADCPLALQVLLDFNEEGENYA